MKTRAAAAILLALALAGCSTPAPGGAASVPSPTQAKTVTVKDIQFQSLESAMEKLDAAGVTYEARVQGPEGTILKDPKAASEKGKWKALLLLDDSPTGLANGELKSGDSVRILISPMVQPTPTPTPTPTTPPDRKVTYVITADGPIASTTFGNMIGGRMSTEQANEVSPPFTKTYTFTPEQFERDFRGFSVTAQAGEGTTTISCKINVDDNPGEVKTSTGPYAVVMCNR